MVEAAGNNYIPRIDAHSDGPMAKDDFMAYAESFGLDTEQAEDIFQAANNIDGNDGNADQLNGKELKNAHDTLFSEEGGGVKLGTEVAELLSGDKDGRVKPKIIQDMMNRGYLEQNDEGEWELSEQGKGFKGFAEKNPNGGLSGQHLAHHIQDADRRGFNTVSDDAAKFLVPDDGTEADSETGVMLAAKGYVAINDGELELTDKGEDLNDYIYDQIESENIDGEVSNGEITQMNHDELATYVLAFEADNPDLAAEHDIQALGAALGTEDSPLFTSADDNAKQLVLENYDGLTSTPGAVQSQIDGGLLAVEDGELVATQKGIEYADFLNENGLVGTSTADGYASMLMKDSGADFDAGIAQDMIDNGLLVVGSNDDSYGNNVLMLTQAGADALVDGGYLDSEGYVTDKGLAILGMDAPA